MSSHPTSVANDAATTTSHGNTVTAIADKIGRNDLTADDQAEVDFWTAALEEHSNRAMLNISRQALAKLLGIVEKLRTEQRPALVLACNHCGRVPSIEVRLGELCATCGIGGFTIPKREGVAPVRLAKTWRCIDCDHVTTNDAVRDMHSDMYDHTWRLEANA
jgi:hypothetical protein